MNHAESDCRTVPGECTVCVHCLSVYLYENLNSTSCFLPFVSHCFTDTARSYGPHTAFIISVFSFALYPFVPSSPSLFSFLSLSLPLCSTLVFCSTLISTVWNWREPRQIKPELEKEEVGDDGGMLMEGALERAGKANRYQGVTLRRKMIWILLCCFLSLSLTLSLFRLCFSSVFAGTGKSA